MNATYLLARWVCDARIHPTLPNERGAVGRLRFESAARLPAVERSALFRLLDGDDHLTPTSAGWPAPRKDSLQWHD